MTHFAYREGVLHAEDVAVPQIARSVGTPFYCYSTAAFEEQYRAFSAAMPKGTLVAYAVKANGNLAVIRTHITLQSDHTATNVARLHYGFPPLSRL